MEKAKILGKGSSVGFAKFEEIEKGDFFLYDDILFVKTDSVRGISLEEGRHFKKGQSKWFSLDDKVKPSIVDFYCV